MTHPFRDCGVWEFDDEHPDGWPVCGDCGETIEGHVGVIPLGVMRTDGGIAPAQGGDVLDDLWWEAAQ